MLEKHFRIIEFDHRYIENLNNKLQKKISNSKQLKLIKPDGVSKQALTHDFSHFDSLLKKVICILV